MSLPLNIKGITTSLTRHLGGDVQNAEHRTFTSTGYGQAMKKILGASNITNTKNVFKSAGIGTHNFATREAIKEKDLINDLKKLSQKGVLKRPIHDALSRLKSEQRREHQKLTLSEKEAFQRLASTTKHELVWGQSSDSISFSHGAQVAADRHKQRDIEVRKMKYGIEGYDLLKEDKDLGKRIKILKDQRHKTEAMSKELEALEAQARMVEQQAKKDPSLLTKFGLMHMERSGDIADIQFESLKEVVGESKSDKSGSDDNKDKKDAKKSSDVPTPVAGGSSSVGEVFFKEDKKSPDDIMPFVRVRQKLSSGDSETQLTQNQSAGSEDTQFGFINTSGDVKIDEND